MRKKRIDYDLQVRVFRYLEHLFLKSDEVNVEAEARTISKLSQSLRKDLMVQANGALISKYFTFTESFSDETLERLSQRMRTANYAPGETIYRVKDKNIYISNKMGSSNFKNKIFYTIIMFII